MNILIVGGSGGIGQALIKHFLAYKPSATIFATYHSHKPHLRDAALHWFQVDATSEQEIRFLSETTPNLDILINAAGILCIQNKKPEKSVNEFQTTFFEQNILSNTLPTILLAKYFQRQLKSRNYSYFVSLSARIGSIEDNSSGGWISYRCSKAALNMAIKTISIEWQYKVPNCCVLSFHPGTTDSELSKPFQKNIPPQKLFSPQFVAQSLTHLLDSKTSSDSGKFFSYDGTEIPW